MRTIYKDFDFLRNLLTEFFAQRSLRSRFRIMEEVQIEIVGITLLTELNAAGKSTVSRTIYYAGYYINLYNKLTDKLQRRFSSPKRKNSRQLYN